MTFTQNNDRSSAATPRRSEESKALDSPLSDSTRKHNTPRRERQPGAIENLLKHGSENAIDSATLCYIAGYRNTRALQQAIAAERENGSLILSSAHGGYYLPSLDTDTGRKEIDQYIKTLRSRALNTLRTLRSARKALLHQHEQIGIDGW